MGGIRSSLVVPRVHGDVMITTLYTRNSICQVDQEAGRARRLNGLNEPTRNWARFADADGWADYVEVRWVHGSVLFVWCVEDDPDRGEVIRRSITSTVLSTDGPPIGAGGSSHGG